MKWGKVENIVEMIERNENTSRKTLWNVCSVHHKFYHDLVGIEPVPSEWKTSILALEPQTWRNMGKELPTKFTWNLLPPFFHLKTKTESIFETSWITYSLTATEKLQTLPLLKNTPFLYLCYRSSKYDTSEELLCKVDKFTHVTDIYNSRVSLVIQST